MLFLPCHLSLLLLPTTSLLELKLDICSAHHVIVTKSHGILKIKNNDNIHRISPENSLNSLKIQNLQSIPTGHFHSSNHQNWLPYQILGSKAVKYVQIDLQTTEILSTKLNLTLWVSQ